MPWTCQLETIAHPGPCGRPGVALWLPADGSRIVVCKLCSFSVTACSGRLADLPTFTAMNLSPEEVEALAWLLHWNLIPGEGFVERHVRSTRDLVARGAIGPESLPATERHAKVVKDLLPRLEAAMAAGEDPRVTELRETLRLADEFIAKSPLKDLAAVMRRHTGILRSELSAREAVNKTKE